MTRLVQPSNGRRVPSRPRPPALRFLGWLWPSLLAGFAAVGFLIIQLSAISPGEFTLSDRALSSLRTIGLCVTVISAGARAVLWPPRALRDLVRRMV